MTLVQKTLVRRQFTQEPVSVRRSRFLQRTVGRNHKSVLLMLFITLVIFGGLGTRLAYLQLIEGKNNRQLSDNNRIRNIPQPAGRGNILDRKGKILAGSRLAHSVAVWRNTPNQANWPTTLKLLSETLNIPEAEIQKRLEQTNYDSPFLRVIAHNITSEQVTRLTEYKNQLQGVEVDVETWRDYPNKQLAAHVLGYVGEINHEELKKRKDSGYKTGDVVGKMGIENVFDLQLRGKPGNRQIEIDGRGKVLRVLQEKPAELGKDMQLTLDLDLQKAAELALGERKGAIVVLNPNNGEVYAMVSRPAFDPNWFTTQVDKKIWQQLQRQQFPFINRALQGYPPASTFKIVTTTAGLESGKFSPSSILGTYPYLSAGGTQFWDWNKAGFGSLGFVGALAMSSNTFFGQIGLGTGEKPLINWARKFGFGEKTGIELSAQEAHGFIADDAWKRKNLNEGWHVGDTINTSIGQGFLQTSPLQVAVMFSVVANGGYRVQPHLLKASDAAQNKRESLSMKPETIRVLQEGLRAVVSEGTGKALNVPTLPPVAGKSGTAEDPPRESHAWFGAYAPYDKPEIVVVAFAENSGGGGGKVAAPMVRQVMEAYFKSEKLVTAASSRN